MKTKKAFSLIELVVVIAVIAILAGVTITVMTSTLGKAKDNTDLIELKSRISEIKNNDIVDQIYDKNWLTLIDCENNIAKDIANTIGTNIAIQASVSEYVDKSEDNKTNITPDVLDVLIKNSFNDPILGGVTEGQIESIVSVIFNDRTVEDKTTIKNKAITHMYDKGYTAYDVAKVLNDYKKNIASYDFSNITKNTNIVIPEYALIGSTNNVIIPSEVGKISYGENKNKYVFVINNETDMIKMLKTVNGVDTSFYNDYSGISAIEIYLNSDIEYTYNKASDTSENKLSDNYIYFRNIDINVTIFGNGHTLTCSNNRSINLIDLNTKTFNINNLTIRSNYINDTKNYIIRCSNCTSLHLNLNNTSIIGTSYITGLYLKDTILNIKNSEILNCNYCFERVSTTRITADSVKVSYYTDIMTGTGAKDINDDYDIININKSVTPHTADIVKKKLTI